MLNNYNKFKLISLVIIVLFSQTVIAELTEDSGAVINHNSVDISTVKQYPEYQVEAIVFSHPKNKISLFSNNNNQAITESFPEHTGNLNKHGSVNFVNLSNQDNQDNQEPIRLVLKDQYNKLKTSNYKIILHQATKYNILPSQRNKKFLIRSELLEQDVDFVADDDNFQGVLVITPIKNAFNLSLDGIFANFRLTKSAKIKPKEVYYFDHPKFGVLVTMVELK